MYRSNISFFKFLYKKHPYLSKAFFKNTFTEIDSPQKYHDMRKYSHKEYLQGENKWLFKNIEKIFYRQFHQNLTKFSLSAQC